ncbi:MAG: DMT family transporter [Rhodospirillaceae bacterium]|nr:DMT family transporter [Rhodospirillaceae bacterium]MCY4237814.1 DMT family transporter [Rhodospirillaceae bacterium]
MTVVSTSSAKAPTVDRILVGYLLILVSTICFSASNNLAKESYSHGVSVDTMLVGRSWSLAVLLGLWFVARRRRPTIPAGMTGWVIAAAMLFSANAWSLLSSFDVMPVSLSILVFYLFPFLVGLLAAVMGIEKLRGATVVGLVVAFLGLILTLDTEGSPDLWGIFLAFIAGVAIALNILISGKLFRRGMSAVAVAFWMTVGGAVFFSIGLLAGDGLELPGGSAGWGAFIGTILFVGIAFVTFYSAVARLTESRTALVMNLEPVFTILIAVVVFGEPFGWSQWLGAALVTLAVVWVSAAGYRR